MDRPGSRWRFLNPMEWLKPIYELIGTRYPVGSLIIATLLGAMMFGGGWWLLGRQYEKERNGSKIDRPPKEPEKRMNKDDLPKIPKGSVVSFNQSGGITAGHVTMTGPGPVRVSFSSISENQPEKTADGQTIFTSNFRIALSGPVPEFIVAALAQSIIDMALIPEGGTGIVAGSIFPVKDGKAQHSINNALGGYIVRVKSRNPEQFKLVYRCNGVECVGP